LLEKMRSSRRPLAGFVFCGIGIVFLVYRFSTGANSTQTQSRQEGKDVPSFEIGGVNEKRSISHQTFSVPYDKAVPVSALRSQSEGKIKRDFWKSHKPSYNCSSSSRIGEKGDGGKWMCGLEPFGKLTVEDNYPCVFYSFGVKGNSEFEAEVLLTTTCSVHAYDMSVQQIGKPLKSSNPRVHFHKMGISGTNSENMKTLKTLMGRNGHTFIDILKIDVEGSEYESFDRIFEDYPDQLPFGQLMIELHGKVKDKVFNIVEQLEKRGLRLFSVEPNALSIDCCAEYSFVNLRYRKLFIPD